MPATWPRGKTGFWFRWDHHPQVRPPVDGGVAIKIGQLAAHAGGSVPVRNAGKRDVPGVGGKFVPAYALPGKLAFRCFEYDPSSGRYSLDWGLVLLMLPGGFAVAATASVFYGAPSGVDRGRRGRPETESSGLGLVS